MKRTGLLLAIVTIVFALAFAACKKDKDPEPAKDYRDAWVGGYFYNLRFSYWDPDTSYVNHYSGTLSVTSVGDKFVGIQLSDSTRYWLCEVSNDGNLTFIEGNSYWREFEGSFPKSDSLYLDCANYGPGAGARLTYKCNR